MSKAPLTDAERQRRYRDRQRRGVVLAMVEIPPDLVEGWISDDWITEEDSRDPDRLGDLIKAIIQGRAPLKSTIRIAS